MPIYKRLLKFVLTKMGVATCREHRHRELEGFREEAGSSHDGGVSQTQVHAGWHSDVSSQPVPMLLVRLDMPTAWVRVASPTP